jgi:sulfate/thiosulfate transport system ATP-binding protein
MSILLENLRKTFGSQLVVDQVSLEIEDRELFVLLGGSGSGKSTILRMIAGLTDLDDGRVWLQGRDVTFLPPQKRGIGFVFQNYSIFRHMSVGENIEFGLKIRNVPATKRAERREELLDLVGLAGLGNRYSEQLSGGQRQRVALARALAYEPSVLLLDEPFGALDVKIRAQLRRSLKEIQQRLGITMVLVTHDQEEAFELADRIGVVERGRLLEVGPPETLYSRPQSLFVATFVGAGNVLVGRAEGGVAHYGPLRLPIPSEVAHDDEVRARVLFRPEQIVLSQEPPSEEAVTLGRGCIIEQNFSGAVRRVRLRLPRLPRTRQVAPVPPFGEEGLLIDALVPTDSPLETLEQWVILRNWHILAPPEPRLLLWDDGAAPTSSLRVARLIADSLRAAVDLLGVAEDQQKVEEKRVLLAQRQLAAGLGKAELRLRHGNPAEQIRREQAESFYEMVIVPGGDNAGQTLPAILERPDLPVLVARGAPGQIARVLICTATGEPGKSDIRVGGRLARRLGAAVTLLYITPEDTEVSPLARSHLERGAATLRALDVPCEICIRAATTPAGGILTEARDGNHDLIVVGGHGPEPRSIFSRDDITLQVLAEADHPVLVVPAEEG